MPAIGGLAGFEVQAGAGRRVAGQQFIKGAGGRLRIHGGWQSQGELEGGAGAQDVTGVVRLGQARGTDHLQCRTPGAVQDELGRVLHIGSQAGHPGKAPEGGIAQYPGGLGRLPAPGGGDLRIEGRREDAPVPGILEPLQQSARHPETGG